jgi:two-component system, NarL family, nitrate/nitrite response regulator NarL
MVREREEAPSSRSRGSQLRGSSQRHGWIPTVIVDNSALFRAGLTHILAGTRFRVMAGCSGLKDIQKSCLHRRACLALVGLDKGARAVLTELSFLKAQYEYFRVVIFSDRFDLQELLTAIAAGGDCYLLKNEISPDVLLKSLDLVLLGETIVPQGFTQLIRSQVRLEQDALSRSNDPGTRLEYPRAQVPTETLQTAGTRLEYPRAQVPTETLQTDEIARLSNREQLILFHMTQGASNKHIARELKITEATVKTHVKALLHKIGARNRTQAAVWAINHFGPSRLDEAKSLEKSAGLPVVLAQLGRLGLDLADGSAVTRQAEQKVYAVPLSPMRTADHQRRV